MFLVAVPIMDQQALMYSILRIKKRQEKFSRKENLDKVKPIYNFFFLQYDAHIYRFYSFLGHVGGDVSYNAKRGMFGAISLVGRTSYHLFSVNSRSSDPRDIVKLCRQSKWHPQHHCDSGKLNSLFIIPYIF